MMDEEEEEAVQTEENQRVHVPRSITIETEKDDHVDDDDNNDDGDDDDDDNDDESDAEKIFQAYAFGLDKNTFPRSICIKIVSSTWFDNFTILVILINCICMSFYQPCAECKSNVRCSFLDLMDYAVLGYFIMEMGLKMMAYGLYGQGSYFSSGWTRVDFSVAIAGIIEVVLEILKNGGGRKTLKVLSIIRVLRPLRAVNQVPSVKQIVNLLLDTLPLLRNVLILCAMMFFLCGIVGVQLWWGIFRNRCFIGDISKREVAKTMEYSVYYRTGDPDAEYICSADATQGLRKCHDLPRHDDCFGYDNITESLNGTSMIDQSEQCHIFDTCLGDGPNPFRGSLNFDNIFYAFLTIFVVISKEGWVDIMYYTQDAQSFWTFIYYMVVIIFGAVFVVNLFLVVISIQFTELKRREQKRMKTHYLNMGNIMTAANATPNLYDALVNCIASLCRKIRTAIARRAVKPDKESLHTAERWFTGALLLNKLHHVDKLDKATQTRRIPVWLDKALCRFHGFIRSHTFNRIVFWGILVNTLAMSLEHYGQPDQLTVILERFNYVFTGLFTIEMVLKLSSYGIHGYFRDFFNLFDAFVVLVSLLELTYHSENLEGLTVLRSFRLLRILKLLRFLPSLQFELTVMFDTINEVSVFGILMTLFILMFSLMGMVIFGKRFCRRKVGYDDLLCSCSDLRNASLGCQCDRTNFDTFANATLTVFQILTTEDWNAVLFNGMEATNHWAALYFVCLIAIGNYMLFNLLIAILVEGFQNQKYIQRIKHKATIQRQAASKLSQNLHVDYRACRVRGAMRRAFREKILEILKEPTMPDIYRGAFNPSFNMTFIDEEDNEDPMDERVPLLLKMFKSRVRWEAVTDTAKAQIRRQLFVTKSTENLDSLNFKIDRKANLIARSRRRHTFSGEFPIGSTVETQTEPQKPMLEWVHKMYYRIRPPRRGLCGLDDLTPNYRFSKTKEKRAWRDTLFDFDESEDEEAKNDSYIMRIPQLILQQRLAVSQKYHETIFYNRRNHAFYCIPEDHYLRNICKKIVANTIFELFILFLIVVNCLVIALVRPGLTTDSWEMTFLTITYHTSTLLFVIEMLIKMIAQGVISGRTSYLRDPWNCLDCLIVIVGILDIALEIVLSQDEQVSILDVIRVLRVMRALRPVRLVTRYPSLRLAVEALIASFKEIVFILIISCIFFIIFGILGVQMFKGAMQYCNKEEAIDAVQFHNITTKEQCKAAGFQWKRRKYNFDNLGQALLTLFTISTLDGWVKVMHQGIDAVGVDMQPQLNHNHWRVLYFVAFILIVGFVVLNMFVGVLVDKFQEADYKLKTIRRQTLTPTLALHHSTLMLGSVKHRKISRRSFGREDSDELKQELVQSKHGRFMLNKVWKWLCDLMVLANVFCIASEHYNMSHEFILTLNYCYMVFLFWYTVEMLLKMWVLRPLRYFHYRWHWLELSIIVLCFIGFVLSLTGTVTAGKAILGVEPYYVTVLRVAIIARVFLLVLRISKRALGLWELVTTLKQSLPDIANICILFFVLFFIYAALGVELFGELPCMSSEKEPCEAIDEHANFKNFGMAFLTLFRILTGDSWSGILTDALRKDCDSTLSCGGSPNGVLTICYFVTFILNAQFVLLNVAVAMLMKGLKESHRELFEESVAKAFIVGRLDMMNILPRPQFNSIMPIK